MKGNTMSDHRFTNDLIGLADRLHDEVVNGLRHGHPDFAHEIVNKAQDIEGHIRRLATIDYEADSCECPTHKAKPLFPADGDTECRECGK